MTAPASFRAHLTRRLLVALCHGSAVGCGVTVVEEGGEGGGGTSTSEGGAGQGGQGGQGGTAPGSPTGIGGPTSGGGSWTEEVCIEWPPQGTSGGGEPTGCPGLDEVWPYLPETNVGCAAPIATVPSDDPDECCYTIQYDCGVGRPYVQDGEALAAAPRWGEASRWSDDAVPSVEGLSAEAREVLAEAWCRDGLYEHASVASFGRFALELMAAGAPPELVVAAQAAAADEVRHARACLSLAAAYRGDVVTPGAFPFDGDLAIARDLASIAARAAAEGCVGETVASIQAAEQLAVARDPRVREVLAAIVEEEAQHAELAWRTVAWAIAVGGDAVRQAVAAALEAAVARELAMEVEAPVAEALADELAAHGRLGGEALVALRRRAVAEVITPCARRLLSVGSYAAASPSAPSSLPCM